MPQTRRFVIGIWRRIGVISLLGLLAGGSPGAQPQQRALPLEEGTSSISGQVLNAQTRQPVVGVDVSLGTFDGGVVRSATAKTDAAGAFAFDGIAAGSYMLTAFTRDYQPACFPNTAIDRCDRIELLRDDRRTDLELALTPNAIARGRVVDDKGTPIVDATVRVTREVRPSKDGTVTRVTMGRGAKTGADGAFELRGINPGSWYVEALLPISKGAMALPIVFYPGVFQHDEATPIDFSAGRVTGDLNIVVPSTAGNALTVRVAPGPVPIGDVRAAVIRSAPLMARTIALDQEGTGTVKDLLQGRYFIAARGWIKDRAWAAFEIADFVPPSLDVSLQMKPAGSITGRIVAQNGGLPPLVGVVAAAGWTHDDVEINPMTPDQVPVEADGSFTVEGLFGKRTLRLIGLSPEWAVSAVRQGRSEVRGAVDVPLDTTVDVTIIVARR